MTNLHSDGWGVLLDLKELQELLERLSNAERSWSADLRECPNEPPRVAIVYKDARPDSDLTVEGYEFVVLTDSFPWLTAEPLVALHPALARSIKKPGVEQSDPLADFDVIWPPVREALAIEGLRGAANTLGRSLNHKRCTRVG